MGIVSYAQNFEDVLLNRVFASVHYAFYVDIGAYHPVTDSVTKTFYDRGWDGINIEPGEIFHELAAARTRDVNLQMAVYDHPGTVSFAQHPGWYAGLSHVRPEPAAPTDAPSSPHGVEIITVPCDTLANILERHASGRPIAFLKIDAEGSEEAIIRSTDWRAIRPTVILIEATKPRSTVLDNQRWEPVLIEHGYQRAYFDGINCYYVPDERADLLRHFDMPVNILDGWQRFDPQAAAMRAQIEAAEARIGELTAESARTAAFHHEQNAATQRELHATRERLETAQRSLDAIPAQQNAAVATAVAAAVAAHAEQAADAQHQLDAMRRHLDELRAELDALHPQLGDWRARHAGLEAQAAALRRERDALLAVRDQAARYRRLLRELQWPDGPAALRAVLPLARLLRRLAGTKAPPIPPEEHALLAHGGASTPAPPPAAPTAPPPPPHSLGKRAARLVYRPLRPLGRPPALRLRAFLTDRLHDEFMRFDDRLDQLRAELARTPPPPPTPAAPAVADPRLDELQTEIRQFGKLLEHTLMTLAMEGVETRRAA